MPAGRPTILRVRIAATAVGATAVGEGFRALWVAQFASNVGTWMPVDHQRHGQAEQTPLKSCDDAWNVLSLLTLRPPFTRLPVQDGAWS